METLINQGVEFEKYLAEQMYQYYKDFRENTGSECKINTIKHYTKSLYQCEEWLKPHIDYILSNIDNSRRPLFDCYNSIGINTSTSTYINRSGFVCRADGILRYENRFTILEIKRNNNFNNEWFKSYIIQLLTTSYIVNKSGIYDYSGINAVLISTITDIETTIIVKIDYNFINYMVEMLIKAFRCLLLDKEPNKYKDRIYDVIFDTIVSSSNVNLLAILYRIENYKVDVDILRSGVLSKYTDITISDVNILLNKKVSRSPL